MKNKRRNKYIYLAIFCAKISKENVNELVANEERKWIYINDFNDDIIDLYTLLVFGLKQSYHFENLYIETLL